MNESVTISLEHYEELEKSKKSLENNVLLIVLTVNGMKDRGVINE